MFAVVSRNVKWSAAILMSGWLAFLAWGHAAPADTNTAAYRNESPTAFLHRVFVRYIQIDSWPKDYRPTQEFAEGRFAYLIDRDNELFGLQGDEGLLDADPICNCQDWDSAMPQVSGHYLPSGRYLARLSVTPPDYHHAWSLVLVHSAPGWKVFDRLNYGVYPSVRRALEGEIKACERARKLHPKAEEPC